MLRRLILTLVLTLAVAPLGAVMPVGAQPTCFLRDGFAVLHELAPGIVGECVEDAWIDPETGDVRQRTTNGLLIRHRIDSWTGFTNGTMTWVDGPFGLQSRLNTEQFPWESLADLAVPEPVSGAVARPLSAPLPPVAVVPPPDHVAPESDVAEHVLADNGNDNDDPRPRVVLDVSKDQVDRNESFEIRVAGHHHGDGGISKVWWWASGTDDPDLRDTHIHECDDTSSCGHAWQQSTDNGGRTIRIHARARDRDGRDSDEAIREIRVR
jgi:hypothetical protein